MPTNDQQQHEQQQVSLPITTTVKKQTRFWPFQVYINLMLYLPIEDICRSRRICRDFRDINDWTPFWEMLIERDLPFYGAEDVKRKAQQEQEEEEQLKSSDMNNNKNNKSKNKNKNNQKNSKKSQAKPSAAAAASSPSTMREDNNNDENEDDDEHDEPQQKKNDHPSSPKRLPLNHDALLNVAPFRARFLHDLGGVFFNPGRAAYGFVSLAQRFPCLLTDIANRSRNEDKDFDEKTPDAFRHSIAFEIQVFENALFNLMKFEPKEQQDEDDSNRNDRIKMLQQVQLEKVGVSYLTHRMHRDERVLNAVGRLPNFDEDTYRYTASGKCKTVRVKRVNNNNNNNAGASTTTNNTINSKIGVSKPGAKFKQRIANASKTTPLITLADLLYLLPIYYKTETSRIHNSLLSSNSGDLGESLLTTTRDQVSFSLALQDHTLRQDLTHGRAFFFCSSEHSPGDTAHFFKHHLGIDGIHRAYSTVVFFLLLVILILANPISSLMLRFEPTAYLLDIFQNSFAGTISEWLMIFVTPQLWRSTLPIVAGERDLVNDHGIWNYTHHMQRYKVNQTEVSEFLSECNEYYGRVFYSFPFSILTLQNYLFHNFANIDVAGTVDSFYVNMSLGDIVYNFLNQSTTTTMQTVTVSENITTTTNETSTTTTLASDNGFGVWNFISNYFSTLWASLVWDFFYGLFFVEWMYRFFVVRPRLSLSAFLSSATTQILSLFPSNETAATTFDHFANTCPAFLVYPSVFQDSPTFVGIFSDTPSHHSPSSFSTMKEVFSRYLQIPALHPSLCPSMHRDYVARTAHPIDKEAYENFISKIPSLVFDWHLPIINNCVGCFVVSFWAIILCEIVMAYCRKKTFDEASRQEDFQRTSSSSSYKKTKIIQLPFLFFDDYSIAKDSVWFLVAPLFFTQYISMLYAMLLIPLGDWLKTTSVVTFLRGLINGDDDPLFRLFWRNGTEEERQQYLNQTLKASYNRLMLKDEMMWWQLLPYILLLFAIIWIALDMAVILDWFEIQQRKIDAKSSSSVTTTATRDDGINGSDEFRNGFDFPFYIVSKGLKLDRWSEDIDPVGFAFAVPNLPNLIRCGVVASARLFGCRNGTELWEMARAARKRFLMNQLMRKHDERIESTSNKSKKKLKRDSKRLEALMNGTYIDPNTDKNKKKNEGDNMKNSKKESKQSGGDDDDDHDHDDDETKEVKEERNKDDDDDDANMNSSTTTKIKQLVPPPSSSSDAKEKPQQKPYFLDLLHKMHQRRFQITNYVWIAFMFFSHFFQVLFLFGLWFGQLSYFWIPFAVILLDIAMCALKEENVFDAIVEMLEYGLDPLFGFVA